MNHYAGDVKIYTRDGDDGTTGLYFGGRASKSSEQIDVNGAVDEAQSSLGWARSLAESNSRLDVLLISVERDLWVLMAEVATAKDNRHKLAPGKSLVTSEMITALESEIDSLSEGLEIAKDFIVPGENQLSAALDVARTVIRRAERLAVGYALGDSLVVAYLNRLSDLAWTMARFAEGTQHRTVKSMS
jgi:cob(I)alamin adenosyltransferase